MQTKTLLKLSALANLVQLVVLSVVVAWFGQTYLVDSRNYRTYAISTFKANQWVGQSFPVIPLQTTRGDTVRTDFAETQGGLVVLFDPTSCQPCLELVLETLQHVYDRLDDPAQLPVYALSSMSSAATQFSRAFKLKYQLGTLPSDDNGTYDRLLERTPVIFLIDSRQTILQCHYPLVGRDQFTQLFFWKLVSIHLPALEVNTDRFADSPLKKLKGLSFLDVIKGRHTLTEL
jgi:hypothetical protein